MAIRQTSPILFHFMVVLALFASTTESQSIQLLNIPCEETVRESSRCGAGGIFNGEGTLSGTFVCRSSFASYFFNSKAQSVCTPTVLNQVIGFEGDQCGCCDGECPRECTCVCDAVEDKVLVVKKRYLFGETTECLSRGKASRKIATGNYYCVADSDCPALPPPETDEGSDEQEVEVGREVEPGK